MDAAGSSCPLHRRFTPKAKRRCNRSLFFLFFCTPLSDFLVGAHLDYIALTCDRAPSGPPNEVPPACKSGHKHMLSPFVYNMPDGEVDASAAESEMRQPLPKLIHQLQNEICALFCQASILDVIMLAEKFLCEYFELIMSADHTIAAHFLMPPLFN
jgi:hypothetical protein